MSKEISEISFHTFPDSHGRDCAFDGILALFSIFAVQVDTELIIFSLPRCPYAHRDRLEDDDDDNNATEVYCRADSHVMQFQHIHFLSRTVTISSC